MTKCDKMKRGTLLITSFLICLAVLAVTVISKQYYERNYSGVPDAVSSSYFGRECRLTVSANASRIDDREAFASEVFGMCRENSFQTIRLSTDVMGWPSSLYITVYLHRNDIGRKEPEMRIRFLPPDENKEYNIKDNGSEYLLFIE